MILIFIRIILILILLLLIVLNYKISYFFKDSTNQLILALIVIFTIIVLDATSGFILGLIFLVIYYKYYNNLLNIKIKKEEEQFNNIKIEDVKKPCTKSIPYISPELLESAQNNIIDSENNKTEIIGFTSDKKIYGIQGFDNEKNNYKGFDKCYKNYATL